MLLSLYVVFLLLAIGFTVVAWTREREGLVASLFGALFSGIITGSSAAIEVVAENGSTILYTGAYYLGWLGFGLLFMNVAAFLYYMIQLFKA